jgi:hypothetical protein
LNCLPGKETERGRYSSRDTEGTRGLRAAVRL